MKTKNAAGSMAVLIFTNVLWGFSFLFSKTLLADGIPTMSAVFLRYVIAAAVMVPLSIRKTGGLRLHAMAPRALLSALTGITVYYFLEYTGLQHTTASAASLILALVPMMTLLVRVLFLKERLSPLRWLCVLVSLLGVYLVIASDASGASGSLLGNLVMVAACVCWTGYIFIMPKLTDACDPLRVTAWQTVAAAITIAPFALMERAAWVMPSPAGLVSLLVLSVFCSALCYLWYNTAIAQLDSLSVSLTININPIAACIGGALFLGERLTSMQLLGGTAILACVLLDAVICAKMSK